MRLMDFHIYFFHNSKNGYPGPIRYTQQVIEYTQVSFRRSIMMLWHWIHSVVLAICDWNQPIPG